MTRFQAPRARRLRMRIALFVAVLAVAGVSAGCGGSGASTTSGSTTNSSGQLATEAQPAPLALHLNKGSHSVSTPQTTVSGTVFNGASVTVNGHHVAVSAGRWRDKLSLHIGNNPVEVEATMGNRAPATTVIHVIRHHSQAELEALAHERALRAEAKRRHEIEARERKERERQQREQQQATTCPNGTYENAAGHIVCKPYESPTQPAGATAECADGTYSFSESRSGTCSHHGGVARWLNE